MNRIFLAIRIFFRALLDRGVAEQVQQVLDGRAATDEPAAGKPGAGKPGAGKPGARAAGAPPAAPAATRPARSEALTLLATLQREARFVDFVQESLDSYSDAQVGAAARDVQRNCGVVLQRAFGIEALVTDDEQAMVDIPVGYDPARYQLVGNVTGQPPFRGRLAHHGWKATRCELAAWSGSHQAAQVLAPAEVELP
jgi:hypothetical protein